VGGDHDVVAAEAEVVEALGDKGLSTREPRKGREHRLVHALVVLGQAHVDGGGGEGVDGVAVFDVSAQEQRRGDEAKAAGELDDAAATQGAQGLTHAGGDLPGLVHLFTRQAAGGADGAAQLIVQGL
jgi:hypothetical protein